MDLGSLFLILAGVLLAAVIITRPFLDRKVETAPLIEQKIAGQKEHQRSSLLAERDRLLNTIQELDFDFALGKIPVEDYPAQRELLIQNGVDILRKLDALDKVQADESIEERLEEAIAARRAAAPATPLLSNAAGGTDGNADFETQPSARRSDATARLRPPSGAGDELEAMIAARRLARRDKAAGFCPQCGKPVMKSDRFCSNCGTLVAVAK